MHPGANVQIARAPVALHAPSSIAWTDGQWIDSFDREPSLLAELGIPLRCFHADRGYFLACFLPGRGWYWATGDLPARPDRWSAPLPRSGRRPAAY